MYCNENGFQRLLYIYLQSCLDIVNLVFLGCGYNIKDKRLLIPVRKDWFGYGSSAQSYSILPDVSACKILIAKPSCHFYRLNNTYFVRLSIYLSEGCMRVLRDSVCWFCILLSYQTHSGAMGESLQFKPRWQTEASALYLQSSTGALNIAGYKTVGGFDEYINVGNIWGWGFDVRALYQYQENRAVSIGWYSIANKRNVFLAGPIVNAAGVPLSGPRIETFDKAKWDSAHIELMQNININQDSKIRVFAGAEYAFLQEQLTFNSPGTGSEATYRSHNTSYSGFGPRVGVGLFYTAFSHLDIYSSTAIGVLAGTSRESGLGNTADNVRSGHSLSSVLIVPDILEKLGVTYGRMTKMGEFSLDGGWMWVNYFQALITRVGDVIHEESFGFQGPYFGLKWVSG